MDEGWVVLVVEPSGVCEAFPFATRKAADAASEWFHAALGPTTHTTVIDDHDRGEDDDDDKEDE